MEDENQFDRESFAAQVGRPPRPSSSLGGLLLFVALLGLIGFVGYKYIEANGLPAFESGDANLGEILNKIEEIEQRLDRLEKRQRRSASESTTGASHTAGSTPGSGRSAAGGSSAPSRPFVVRNRPLDRVPGSNPAYDNRVSHLQDEVGALQGDVAAGQEAWEATTDRLGRAVAEVGSQRSELAGIKQRLDLAERTQLSFILHENMGRQRIGPVWLRLRGSDVKNQRYTVRLFVDDKWIEMKDRALHEKVEFYKSGVGAPLELVVSEIGEDQITGILAVPQEAARR